MASLIQVLFNTSSTQNATVAPTPSAAAAPEDFSTFLVALVPFGALATLPDWLKLAVIGTLLETCRRVANQLWCRVRAMFNITARFDVQDTSFEWVMFWLSQQPAFQKARDIEVSTRAWGSRPNGYLVPGEKAEDGMAQRELSYVPSPSMSYSLWFKGRPMTIVRTRKEGGSLWRSEAEESLDVSIMTRDRGVLNALLLEAKTAFTREQLASVSVYVADVFNDYWRHVAARPKRSLNSIVLDPGTAAHVLADARDFLASRAWYAARGIPFRRGYLLHGAPGSGKTSLIHAIAGALGLNVYIVSLSQTGLDDTRLQRLIAELPERCIALMEDIDAAFHRGLNRAGAGGPTEDGKEGGKEKEKDGKAAGGAGPDVGGSRITLSGLLNALDGVGAQEGRVLFATTNCYSALDPALIRPGRMDVHVEFGLASRYQAGELFRRFYMPTEGEDGRAVEETGKGELETKEMKEQGEKGRGGGGDDASTDSGYTSTPGTPRSESIPALADRFAAALPEHAFSMAELQGYLMMYKTRALDAAEGAGAWAEAEIEEKRRRGRAVAPGTGAKEDVKEDAKEDAKEETKEETR